VLVVRNAQLPRIAFLFETIYFRYAMSFKIRNVGLETDFRGILKKTMKYYRVP
jgi:hypothetical protein